MKYSIIETAKAFIRNEIGNIKTDIAILTGTGMSGVDQIGNKVFELEYEEIPNFPKPTVKSHAGILSVLEIQGQYILVFSGRFHYYEGYMAKEICFPIYIMQALGVKQLIMTNASGGLNGEYLAGDVVAISDHINLMPINPLRGKNDDRLGLRFPDMSEAYSKGMLEKLQHIMQDDFKSGVYAAMPGPSLETPAEYKYLKIIGADLVGMSTVPEVIAAVHSGIECCVLSVVSNICYPLDAITETTIEEVIRVVQQSNHKVVQIISALLGKMIAEL